jgi:hypothetical protein
MCADIRSHMTAYIGLLDKLMLSAGRNTAKYWLLAFYSMCVQGHVRQALITIETLLSLMSDNSAARAPFSENSLRDVAMQFILLSEQDGSSLEKQIQNKQRQPSGFVDIASWDAARPGPPSPSVLGFDP